MVEENTKKKKYNPLTAALGGVGGASLGIAGGAVYGAVKALLNKKKRLNK